MVAMREDMDVMLEQARSFAFAADAALKDAQRSLCRDGSLLTETTALKEIRDDIWALEDKVRAAKWATNAADKAYLASQIDPLMLQVMGKCDQHKDQVRACQDLIREIMQWCERGTSAYRFTVEGPAAGKAPARYSTAAGGSTADATSAGLQGRALPASRIPGYKSPTKRSRGGSNSNSPAAPQPSQQTSAQLLQLKAQSRIPQPQAKPLARKSLPDAQQQQTATDQAGRERSSSGGSISSVRPAGAAAAAAGPAGSRPAAANAGAMHPAAALLAQATIHAARGATAAAATGASCEQDSLASDAYEAGGCATQQQQQHVLANPQQQLQQQQQEALQYDYLQLGPLERLSCSSSGSGSGGLLSRGSGGRVPRTLLHMKPSRDDVPLSSAGQLLMYGAPGSTAAPSAPAARAASAAAAAPAGASTAGRVCSTAAQDGSDRPELLIKTRQSQTGPDEACGSAAELAPVPSFTPMLVHQQQHVSPFNVPNQHAAAAMYSSTGTGLNISQDLSMMLRSSALMQAALLSSNASRMHILHDAVARKSHTVDPGTVDVPVVPARLARHKRRPWWAKAARFVAGSAAMAAMGVAGAIAAKAHEDGKPAASDEELSGTQWQQGSRASSSSSSKGRRQHSLERQSLPLPAAQLPFAPMGPAPDASAGCG